MNSEIKPLRSFSLLAVMDVFARTGYQMGKSPLLPLFAISIGADTKQIGWIVGLSVLTGMLFKPFVGRLSDRIGRKPILIFGSLLFALVPLLYQFVVTPAHLIILRFFHGFATAVYGPVMAAMVADIFSENHSRAKAFGWYDFFRSAGYVSGPFLGGVALTYYTDPKTVYLFVGILGFLALIPTLMLPSKRLDKIPMAKKEPSPSFLAVSARLFRSPRVTRSIIIEMASHMVIRMVKPFWTIYAVVYLTPYQVGTVLSVIFGVSFVTKPLTGYFTARFGHRFCLMSGAILIGLGTPLLFSSSQHFMLSLLAAIILGIGDGLIMPAMLHLLSLYSPANGKGLTMGVLGACRNCGKAMGPILAGYAISYSGELVTAYGFGLVLVGTALYLTLSPAKSILGLGLPAPK